MVAAVATISIARRPMPGHLALGTGALALAAAHLLSFPFLTHSIGWASISLLMTLWCAKCAWAVLRGGSPHRLLIMSAAMGMIHMVMALGMPWFAGHHHSSVTTGAGHGAFMLVLALAEFLMMFSAALLCHNQHRRAQLSR